MLLLRVFMLLCLTSQSFGEKLLERNCDGQKCYEVVEKLSNDGVGRVRQLYLKDGRSPRYLLSQGTLSPSHEFVMNEVQDAANRAIIGAMFASQSVLNKNVNVLYQTNTPGEIDRYFAQNEQFNATTLISDLSALEISRKCMCVENNGIKYIHDPTGEYLDFLQSNGELFDVYIIDRCDYWKGKKIFPAETVFSSHRLQYFTSLLKPNGVLIIRLSSGESSAEMASITTPTPFPFFPFFSSLFYPDIQAEMAMDELFSTCYKYPEEVRRRGEMQLLICSLLPSSSPWEHLRRSIQWKEAALSLPRFNDLPN